MRLHTQLDSVTIGQCLHNVKISAKVTWDVEFMALTGHHSNTHAHGYEIQLGTIDKNSLPAGTVDQHGKNMKVRRFKNSGDMGASDVYSATYFEWGWLMAEIFRYDPSARWGGSKKHPIYANEDDFNAKTGYKFL